jgi:hypothetical protein
MGVLTPIFKIEENKMTITESIARINSLKPNSYSDIDKIRWLSELDGKIKSEVIDTHEGSEGVVFNGYDENTIANATNLLVPSPYDNLYVLWLESKIDYYNGEYARYNNSSTAFNVAYLEFAKYYNRTHMPKAIKLKNF